MRFCLKSKLINVHLHYMKNLSKYLLPLFALASVTASAQTFEWKVNFDTRFDNREYAPCKYSTSETVFGASLAPQVGIGWGKGSKLMAGADLSGYFGRTNSLNTPEALMYYTYSSPNTKNLFSATAGMFRRETLIGDYSYSIFGERYRFYDRVINGIVLQYRGSRGLAELGVDWDGMFEDSTRTRESFRIFSAGRIDVPYFFAGYGFSMYHLANAGLGATGVVDNIIANPYVGLNFAHVTPLDKLYLKLGWQQSVQRNRSTEDKFTLPFGGEIEIGIEKWGVGITNNTYIGKNLFTHWDMYHRRIYAGDQFYRTEKGIYNRTDIYYHAVHRNGIDLMLKLVFHYDGTGLGFQQVAQLNVYLDNGLFGQNTKFGGKRNRPKE